jgi:hypothetical protein
MNEQHAADRAATKVRRSMRFLKQHSAICHNGGAEKATKLACQARDMAILGREFVRCNAASSCNEESQRWVSSRDLPQACNQQVSAHLRGDAIDAHARVASLHPRYHE